MPTLNWIGKEAVVKHHKDDMLPKFSGLEVIYAVANRMDARAGREGVVFKQTPYALEV